MLRESRTNTTRSSERGKRPGGSSVRGGERRIVTALCYDLVGRPI